MPPDACGVMPRGRFLRALREANGLGRGCFAAHEAMLFATRKSWWGRRKARPLPHEGVDLCRCFSEGGLPMTLGPGALVPVVSAGKVWAVTDDDFIGQSVYVRHEGAHGVFFTAYAHVLPREGLTEGVALFTGEVLATLADPATRNLSIAPHLHFSLMTFPDGLPREKLRWATMRAGTEVCFHDPATLLGEELIICDEAAEPAYWQPTGQ